MIITKVICDITKKEMTEKDGIYTVVIEKTDQKCTNLLDTDDDAIVEAFSEVFDKCQFSGKAILDITHAVQNMIDGKDSGSDAEVEVKGLMLEIDGYNRKIKELETELEENNKSLESANIRIQELEDALKKTVINDSNVMDYEKILTMLVNGESYTNIANACGIKKEAVYSAVWRFKAGKVAPPISDELREKALNALQKK